MQNDGFYYFRFETDSDGRFKYKNSQQQDADFRMNERGQYVPDEYDNFGGGFSKDDVAFYGVETLQAFKTSLLNNLDPLAGRISAINGFILLVPVTYMLYLKDVKEKFGYEGAQAQAAAAASTIGAEAVGIAGAFTGGKMGSRFGLGGMAVGVVIGGVGSVLMYDKKELSGTGRGITLANILQHIVGRLFEKKGDKTTESEQDNTDTEYTVFGFVSQDDLRISTAIGLEALFDAIQRERTASAQNAESSANNFGRGTPPSASPTKGPSAPPTPSTPPTNTPTKGPSGTGHSPTSTGASSSNQAPFTKTSSSPTRTYTHPSTTPINTPSFALLKTLTKSSIYYEKMVA